MLCSAEGPTTSTLALHSPEGRACPQQVRLLRQITPEGHRLPARIFQHASPDVPAGRGVQLAGAAQLQAGVASGASAGWAGPHAAAGCTPAWVSSTLAGLVEATVRQLLAEQPQAPSGAQQQQLAQAGLLRPQPRGSTSQPYFTAAAGVQSAAAASQVLASPPQSPAGHRKGRKGKALTKPFPDLSSYRSVRELYDAFTTDNAMTGRVGLLKMEQQQGSTGWRSGKGRWQRWSEQKNFIAEINRQAAALSKPDHPTVEGHQIADKMDAEQQARLKKAIPVATFVKSTNAARCARERADASGLPCFATCTCAE